MARIKEIIVYPEDQLIEWIEYLISDGGNIEDYKDSAIAKAEELGLTQEEAIALLEHKWREANDLEYYLNCHNLGFDSHDRVIKFFSTKDKKEFIKYIKYYEVARYWSILDHTNDIKKKMNENFKDCPEVQEAFKQRIKKANIKEVKKIVFICIIIWSFILLLAGC